MIRTARFGALALVLLAPSFVSADWLVTKDGSRVETEGPWRVEGRQVIFTLPNGTLSAMRASEVDLDASAEATAAAKAPPAAESAAAEDPARPLPEPVLVLTDKDIPKAADTGIDEARADPLSRQAGVGEEVEEEILRVVSWRQSEERNEEGLEIRGTVRNTGKEVMSAVTLAVEVQGEEGSPLATVDAFLASSTVLPGRSTTFRAVLPGVFELYGEPTFSLGGNAVTVGAGSPRDSAEPRGGEIEQELDEEPEAGDPEP
ncbi:MAG: hypothetical protein AAGN66_11720 [Acidobacteriota bacterium]